MRLSPRLELVGSPVFAMAVAVLLVNDHVLKAAWPGFVTGKLSDVAGVVMVAIVAGAVIGRAGPAVLATGVAFTLLKTVPDGAAWLAPVLGGTTRTDPTDLVALLALVPAWRWLRRREVADPGRRRTRRSWALPAVFVPAAVFATTATSCDVEGVGAVYLHRDVLLASASDAEYASSDGGLTWQEWPPDVEIDWPNLRRQTTLCVGETCIAADEPNAALTEATADGSMVVLQLDEPQQEELRGLGNPGCVSQAFETIAAVELDDGAHVVVSMGPAGALHRGPGGTWAWISIGEWRVPPDSGDTYLGIPVGLSAPSN